MFLNVYILYSTCSFCVYTIFSSLLSICDLVIFNNIVTKSHVKIKLRKIPLMRFECVAGM